jgi:hypothetical protein
MTASRMQLRRCGASSGRRTDKERRGRPGRHRPGASADPIAALTAAGRTQDRCRGTSLATAPTTRRTIVVGRFDLPRPQAVRSRSGMDDDTGQVRRPVPRRGAGHASIDGKAGAGPMASGADRPSADPGTPLMERARWDSYASRAQPDQIYRDRNSFQAQPAGYSRPGNGPFLLNRRVPGRNFVIAVACLGEIRRRQSPSSRSATAEKGVWWMPL